MKTILTIIFTLFTTTIFGQIDEYNFFLDKAKSLFKSANNLTQEELDQFDYNNVASLLEKAIQLNPQSTEAKYFLGYTYSRINSKDGRGMLDMNLDLLYKTSIQFEKVIELTPKYTDEIILLDPYSKLSSEWGAMAMSYWYKNKSDSSIWAFREGKKRGGFGNFILELNKNILDACSKNAILVSSGDNFSIPLWYLQIAEKYRTDVCIVDINLLNTNWYPTFLSQKKCVAFDLPAEVLDTLEYKKWASQIVKIKDFSWTIKPSYNEGYLLRGDRVFLSLLKENKFQRDVYFTVPFTEESRLSLKDFLTSKILVDKLSVFKEKKISYEDYKQLITKYLMLSVHLNYNSPDEFRMFDNFRYSIFNKANDYIKKKDKVKAKELIVLLDKYANENKFPYFNENWKNYADYLRQIK
jgi:hypothetical protein